jgi:hypothetical protein
MPQSQSFHGKAVAKGVQRDRALIGNGGDAGVTKQPQERYACDVIAERFPATAGEECFGGLSSQRARPVLCVIPQVIGNRGMHTTIRDLPNFVS